MSETAYQKCEMCGNRVHINHTCKQWNKEKCQGDPWEVRKKLQSKIDDLKKQIRDTELAVKDMRSSLEGYMEQLLKSL